MLETFLASKSSQEDPVRWIKWAAAEAGFRALSMTLIKVIGSLSSVVAHTILSTLVIGAIQSIVAGGVLTGKRMTPWVEGRLVFGSILFGVGAFINSVIAIVAYMYGANIAIYPFLPLLAIVPGVLIDRVWFGEQLVLRQFIGIAFAIFAGWLVLDAPSLADLLDLPIWAWLGLLNALGLAINQGFTRWVKDVDPWVKNLWGGLATFLLSVVALIFLGHNLEIFLAPEAQRILLWSVAIAFVVIGIWSFNVIAYRDGAVIPTKHIFVNGAYLAVMLFVGFIGFKESVSVVQIGGMGLYLGAFVLVNSEVWKYTVRT